MLRGALCAVLAGLAAGVQAGPPEPAVPLGTKLGDLRFKDVRFLERSLSELGARRAFVLVFTTLECPLVGRYLPRLKELDDQLSPRGVQFLAVNVGQDDPLVEIAWQGLRAGCAFPMVQDIGGQVASAVGASRTPEAVVLDDQRVLKYRGRIDGQFRLGGARPEAGRADLLEAIEDVLAGRPVRVAETPADGCRIPTAGGRQPTAGLTYAEHVAPILAAHCQDCHRAEGDGPFPLTGYDEVLPHAETVAEVVADRRMPPWFASAEHGPFVNRRAVTAAERRTVIDWVRTGAAAGDLTQLRPSPAPQTGRWRIGPPDLVLRSITSVQVPASGIVPYQYTILPHVFTADTWLQGVQILAEHPAALHHCNLAYIKLGGSFSDGNFITGQVPGGEAMQLPDGLAFLVPAGSVLGLQMHYVPTGQPLADRISVGLAFARQPVRKQLRHVVVKNTSFQIPPGAAHHEVTASRPLPGAATGVGLFTHMHVRGKDMTFLAHLPGGRRETLLAVPNYSFDWQMPYRWAPGERKFPPGTRIECVSHYDNSAFNPYNPDPTQTVVEGQQTFQEMMYGFVFFTLDDEDLNLTIDRRTGHVVAQPPAGAVPASEPAR